jgi:hypothetical protein
MCRHAERLSPCLPIGNLAMPALPIGNAGCVPSLLPCRGAPPLVADAVVIAPELGHPTAAPKQRNADGSHDLVAAHHGEQGRQS